MCQKVHRYSVSPLGHDLVQVELIPTTATFNTDASLTNHQSSAKQLVTQLEKCLHSKKQLANVYYCPDIPIDSSETRVADGLPPLPIISSGSGDQFHD